MKKLSTFIIVLISALSLFSCTSKPHSTHIEKHIGSDSLYVKYKTMIIEKDNCPACADCAAMALAISYGIDDEITENHAKLVKYYEKNGEIPCPELLCDKDKLMQKIANN
ncbi:MAG: hypothetical protein DRJ10_11995 [Bacteroidetes bacterium]|nr:MAG: hypothetical protein DRJ10_11995 [Bacteroidota bacterium]